ncbi:MAG: hypothetical protein HPY50_03915 [Firmicutes bacterium]|nr:hypothetical protein [Bacillota bacterium]
MKLEDLNSHYQQRKRKPLEEVISEPEEDIQPQEAQSIDTSRFDVDQLIKEIRMEYYAKVYPMLEQGESLKSIKLPVLQKALENIQSFKQVSEKQELEKVYLEFRIKHLIYEMTHVEKPTVSFEDF